MPRPYQCAKPCVMERQPMTEYFDLCDERGRLLGRTKERALVHRDGDWHRAFHCWIVDPGQDGKAQILLQQRALSKDTSPGLWDVSVAGHYVAGEGLEGAPREIAEELGLRVDPDELVHVGWRQEVAFYKGGLIEREVQDVFFLLRPVSLADLRPDPAEVSAVVFVPLQEFLPFSRGRREQIDAAGCRSSPGGKVEAVTLSVRSADLTPRADGYYRKVVGFARSLAAGRARVQRRRWW